ncbi:MAG: hypothetical protein MR970_10705 [Spirochaetia bacterium]|nr:hypothetical protein [Spirochaetia bacterium]MDD7699423.1 hypothetical protein [Spirochaetia bacterium]MDY4210814.1 hypothetical protein [Treponema sp.]
MNKSIYYIFTAISFAFLIAAPGRFAFGLIICAELFFLVLSGFCISFFIKKINLQEMNSVITVASLIFSTVLYKQIIMCIFPLAALQLSFVFYLPAVTSYVIGIIYKNIGTSTKQSLANNLKLTGLFSAFALLFYLIRDIFGYGTFTLPSSNGLIEKIIFSTESFSWCTLFASIPGALFLVSISILLFIFVQNKFKIIERLGDSNDSE